MSTHGGPNGRSRGVVVAVVTALIVVTLGAAATSSSASDTQAAASTPPVPRTTPYPPDPHHALEGALYDDVATAVPDFYGGFSVNPDGSFSIYAVAGHEADLAAALTTAIRTVIEPDTAAQLPAYSIIPVSQSWRTLTSRVDTLTAQMPDFAAIGVRSYGVDPRANSVFVGLSSLDPAAEAQIASKIGSENLKFEQQDPSVQTKNRQTDAVPWYGGDWIDQPAYSENCTSGFSVADLSGATYNTSAGHCGYYTHYNVWNQGSQGYGVTLSRVYCNNTCQGDVQTISTYPGWAAGRVWQSCATCSNNNAIHTSTPPAQGDTVVFDGYFTGPVFATVQGVNTCAYYPGITVCGVDVATNGSTFVHDGDSGGPVVSSNLDGSLNADGWIEGTSVIAGVPVGFFTPVDVGLRSLNVFMIYG